MHLRHQEDWHRISKFIPDEEFVQLMDKDHKLDALMLAEGQTIYEAMANGVLGGFDSFQMEGCLAALTNNAGRFY